MTGCFLAPSKSRHLAPLFCQSSCIQDRIKTDDIWGRQPLEELQSLCMEFDGSWLWLLVVMIMIAMVNRDFDVVKSEKLMDRNAT